MHHFMAFQDPAKVKGQRLQRPVLVRVWGYVKGYRWSIVGFLATVVAGVVNPPGSRSRGHWVSKTIAGTPEEWFHGAEHRAESWWTDWAGWLASHSGAWKPAPSAPGGAGLAATEAAPGRYVQSVSGRRAAAGS